MQQYNPNYFNLVNKSGSTYEKAQFLNNNVRSHGRKKIDKICHFGLFPKIHKIQTRTASMKLPA